MAGFSSDNPQWLVWWLGVGFEPLVLEGKWEIVPGTPPHRRAPNHQIDGSQSLGVQTKFMCPTKTVETEPFASVHSAQPTENNDSTMPTSGSDEPDKISTDPVCPRFFGSGGRPISPTLGLQVL